MDRFETGWLLDFYGPLLTEHRQKALRLYLEEDLSMGEIAGEMGITRQGVHDALCNAEKQLLDYEEKLGLMRRYRQMQEETKRCREILSRVTPAAGSEQALRDAVEALERIRQIEQ